MNMFMRNIMNNKQTRPNRSRTQQIHTRRQYGFHNGYNQITHFQRQNYSNTLPDTLVPVNNNPITPTNNMSFVNQVEVQENPSMIQHQIFNVFIDINVNNLSSELRDNINPRRYFSEFSYEELNIRFFHNEILNEQNIGNEIESVLNSINERGFQNMLNDFQIDDTLRNENDSRVNSREIINQIHQNMTHGEYVHYSTILKNHTCPILLTEFENEDIVSIFNLCNHAIHESTCDKYVQTFTKCPLCNHKLF